MDVISSGATATARASAQRLRMLAALEYPSLRELHNRSANASLVFGMLLLLLLVPALSAGSPPGLRDLLALLCGLGGGVLCYWLLYRYSKHYAELYNAARHNLEGGGILMLTLDRQLPPVDGGFLGLGRSREQQLIQRDSLGARLEGLPGAYLSLCDELRLTARSPALEQQRQRVLGFCALLAFANLPFYLIFSRYPMGVWGLLLLVVCDLLLLRLPFLALRRTEQGAFRHALHDCIHGQEASLRGWEA